MPGYFLQKLSIEGFRGINNTDNPLELRFDPQKVNSIFGVNGLGKSSMFEALNFAIRGKINRLDRMHADEEAGAYYNNCFHPTKTATIILTFAPDDGSAAVEVKVERSPTSLRTVSSPTGQASPEEFLKSLDNPFLLLDHASFLEFVADTPLKRGRAFSSLLGLAEISEFRQVLQVLSHGRTITTDLNLAEFETKISTHESRIRDLSNRQSIAYLEFFKEQIEAGDDYTTSPEAVVESLSLVAILAPYCKDKPIDQVDFGELERRIATAENSGQRLRLSQAIEAIEDLERLASSDVEAFELTALDGLVADLAVNLALTEGADFLSMLTAVKTVITSTGWVSPDECPACETVLGRALLPEVDERLNAYKQVDQAKSALSLHWQFSTWPERLRKLEERLAPADQRKHSTIRSKITGGTATADDVTAAANCLTELEAVRLRRIAELQAEKNAISAVLPPPLVALSSKVKAARNLAEIIPQLAAAAKELRILKVRQAKRNAWKAYIEYAAIIFSDAETSLSTTVAEALEAQYQSSYGKITNNPEIVPVLERSQGSENLKLRLKRFHTLTDVPAASLLPESYRNALGISIYLSASAQRPSTARFMVLDDITSSFDAGHQFALMELIRSTIAHPANPTGPQIILLSHDGLLEKYFDKISSEGSWHHHKLQGLPPTGALLSHGQTPDRLRLVAQQHLDLGNISAAEPIIRQYLEFVLLQIIRKVGILVPVDFAIQDDRKMVGNAVTCIKQAVTLHKAAGQLVLSTTQEADFMTVHSTAIVGNWVSHYETGTMGVFNVPTLRGVLMSIDNIKGCFQYPCSCNGAPQPKFYKSLAAKHCHC